MLAIPERLRDILCIGAIQIDITFTLYLYITFPPVFATGEILPVLTTPVVRRAYSLS